ncbi:MAG: BCCT family transporter [Subdoligranulum sp.]|nr:BCCT family transporter [Subdoligranulum sp.]
MKKPQTQKTPWKELFRQLDATAMIVPLLVVVGLCILFILLPESSTRVVDGIRGFLGNQLGSFYILVGVGSLIVSLYIAFSKYGNIRLGGADEKPAYSNFQWGAMIFTGTMAADILYYSFCEWALYAQESRIAELGGVQDWASTYPLFHWGPVPWSFYMVLSACFGFMIHVRKRTKQKFSEGCRALLGDKVDGPAGKIIDLFAIFALLAGTATTFSLATPLLTAVLGDIFGIQPSVGLTVFLLVLVAAVYTADVIIGYHAIMKMSVICAWLFFALLGYFLLGGGQAQYILETGITAIGNLAQNFIGMVTWADPLRSSGDGSTGFVQNWTVFYWAYWMAWCVATPFFVGVISKGRTVRNTIIGGYIAGLASTFTSFIVFGNYGLGLEMHGRLSISEAIAAGADIPTVILSIFHTLPLPVLALALLFITMVLFYATTFDSLTMVVAAYSYRKLVDVEEPHHAVRIFWAFIFIIFPIGLINAQSSLASLQSVSIVAAFPIGIILILLVASFLKDARAYLTGPAAPAAEKGAEAEKDAEAAP